MYSTEQRKLAIETYIKFDLSAADTVAELGYPTRQSLRAWYKDYPEHGGGQAPEAATGSQIHFGDEAGCRGLLPRARKEPRQDHAQDGLSRQQGVPLRLDRRARPRPAQVQGADPRREPVSVEKRVQVIAELEAGTGPAAEVAEKHGVSRTAPYVWRRGMMGDDVGASKRKAFP